MKYHLWTNIQKNGLQGNKDNNGKQDPTYEINEITTPKAGKGGKIKMAVSCLWPVSYSLFGNEFGSMYPEALLFTAIPCPSAVSVTHGSKADDPTSQPVVKKWTSA